MSQGNQGSSKRFVPSGVDAQSWIGFEHRIQERRFKALVETINTAVAQRDGVAARVALEEARELRPGTKELEALAARVALLPTDAPATGSSRYLWYRGASAVAMFSVGVGLVVGIEEFRSGTTPAPVKVVAPALSEAVARPTPAPPSAAPTVALNAVAPAPAVAPPVAPDVMRAVESARPSEPRREEPVGTGGVSREQARAATAVPNRDTFRPAVSESAAPIPPPSGEIPDEYVAPGPRREGRTGYAEVTTTGSSFAANVMPQPISITAPPPAPIPTTPAAPASPAMTPRRDDTRIAQVLNQYARAYGSLDPDAAQAVWPGVDERALARAFASLESQDVTFDHCDIDVKGALAIASCRGTASYVGKVGSRQARTEPREWTFELKLHGDEWKIEKAQTLAR